MRGAAASRAGAAIAVGLAALVLSGCPDRRSAPAPVDVRADARRDASKPVRIDPVEPAPAADSSPPAKAPPEPPKIGRCAGPLGDKPIMTPCSDDCECSTGYCYDEGFLGGGFCSMDCNAPSIGDCGKIRHPTRPNLQKYGCLQLIALAEAHALKTTRICVLRCGGADECRQYADRYDRCGNYSGGRATMWEGHTIAAFGACIDSSMVQRDRPKPPGGP